ncbi:MAG TPA: DJ-1/PfpI family protein [Parvularculaceae bacterium]|nr:DJ-1/PfpI family protein [Amphiplicatus sp.]MCB9955619.1 DJ-1/PfpI family protein [Caulobacterales bacterium]HOP19062.1 DJ-1/PfpI family protein [Amphiplicatus sp.]HPE32460.1 DJ-1/PfpI family protein [Parvularculaceae bacterium]
MADKFVIAFVLFPNLTQLDFTGPLQVLSRLPGAEVHLVAKTLDLVPSDAALRIPPTTTFDNCPPVDLLCIPGGFGVDQAMQDEALMAFVRREGARAKYVTSVCTGAFILGAAGLLEGKRATTHWAYHDELARVGASPVKERVVRDGNVFTGGGVTAGIDFALTVAAEIAGEGVAQTIQLSLEYDPAPPFNSGSPDKVPAGVRAAMAERYGARLADFQAALAAARKA